MAHVKHQIRLEKKSSFKLRMQWYSTRQQKTLFSFCLHFIRRMTNKKQCKPVGFTRITFISFSFGILMQMSLHETQNPLFIKLHFVCIMLITDFFSFFPYPHTIDFGVCLNRAMIHWILNDYSCRQLKAHSIALFPSKPILGMIYRLC